ncbi:late competence development ComFB family protein [Effusibacillus lacus]|uniref:Competence protein ComFB n=1 Tax=Effusibacillus lacus TaxID=1348429 RepID=A0A292YJW4_9BACL|nr:late competence development ComFB family protein [Effusibacillus lacus]TCS75090.1 competence protein ComFB [Effusibacillus lacus]GAX89043.1 hypothetical protein EFBL_0657 [Effusibacillus lacus]
MTLVNAMEHIIEHVFDEFKERYPLKCDCELCKTDILALTLNHIPPKYVSSDIGEVHIKSQYLNEQLKSDVIIEMTKAAQIVEQNPRHASSTQEA